MTRRYQQNLAQKQQQQMEEEEKRRCRRTRAAARPPDPKKPIAAATSSEARSKAAIGRKKTTSSGVKPGGAKSRTTCKQRRDFKSSQLSLNKQHLAKSSSKSGDNMNNQSKRNSSSIAAVPKTNAANSATAASRVTTRHQRNRRAASQGQQKQEAASSTRVAALITKGVVLPPTSVAVASSAAQQPKPQQPLLRQPSPTANTGSNQRPVAAGPKNCSIAVQSGSSDNIAVQHKAQKQDVVVKQLQQAEPQNSHQASLNQQTQQHHQLQQRVVMAGDKHTSGQNNINMTSLNPRAVITVNTQPLIGANVGASAHAAQSSSAKMMPGAPSSISVVNQNHHPSTNNQLQQSQKKQKSKKSLDQQHNLNREAAAMPMKLQRLPIPVHIDEFIEYGGKAVCSNHVFNFKIVETESDLLTEDKPFFNPKFTHQIYNSDETLRGHIEPSIEVFLSPSTLTPYLNWTTRCYFDQQPSSSSQNQNFTNFQKQNSPPSSCLGTHTHKEDDIVGKLQETFENSLITDRNTFIKIVRNENKKFRPLGKFITEFTRQIEVKKPNSLFGSLDAAMVTKRPKREVQQSKLKSSDPAFATKVFKVYRVNAQQVSFTHLNSHLQAILKFYIESASFIPLDPFWHYFLVYMDNKLVAYATTFDEFQKVPKAPLTISQVLVLPPYQKFGIGSTLLETIYNYYLRVQKCLCMIVEDPADDFQRMKDALDIKMILRAGYFRSIRGLGLANPRKHLRIDSFKMCGLDHREINEIRAKLKLKKENIQRCFELLQIACLDQDDADLHEAYRKYVLRKFTESRDLLLPYFKFENFAEQSMYSFSNSTALLKQQQLMVRQEGRMVEQRCCLGNGQLSCIVGRAARQITPLELSQAASGGGGGPPRSPPPIKHLQIEMPNGTGYQHFYTARLSNKPASDSALMPSNENGGIGTIFGAAMAQHLKRTPAAPQDQAHTTQQQPATTTGISSTVLRANRFTPTPWPEIHGHGSQQVRYKIPATLQAKIRQAITQFVPVTDSDSSSSSSSSWSIVVQNRGRASKASRK